MGWSLPPELSVLQTVIGWPPLAVDSVNFRLKENGFRFRGDPSPSSELGDLWDLTGAPAEARLAYNEALVHRQGYWTVGGSGRDDVPLVRAESRADLWADIERATGDVKGAVRPWTDEDDQEGVTIYLPDSTHIYGKGRGGNWVELDRIEHGLGVVPVVPIVHGARVRKRGGASLMSRVVGLTDACARTLTNLGGAQELLAVPQRYILGVKAGEVTKPDGSKVTPAEMYMGRFLAFSNEHAQMGQFSAADLRNFTEVVNLYAKMASSVTGLPPDYLGYSDANPTAADAIYASRERLVTNVEEIHTPFGESNTRLMDILVRWTGLDDDPDPIECVWQNPATPTFAARADAVTKLYAGGLIPREAAWDELGYSPETQVRYAALLSDDPLERYVAQNGGATGAAIPGSSGAQAVPGPDLGQPATGGPVGAVGV